MDAMEYKKEWEKGFKEAVAFYNMAEGSKLPTYDDWLGISAAFKDGWCTGLRAGKAQNIGGNV